MRKEKCKKARRFRKDSHHDTIGMDQVECFISGPGWAGRLAFPAYLKPEPFFSPS